MTDLEFYKDKYKELIENINNFTLHASNSLEASYSVLNNIKKEIYQLAYLSFFIIWNNEFYTYKRINFFI